MPDNLNKLFATFMMLLFSAVGTAQPMPREELSVKLTSPDQPFRLNVGLIEGNINVIGYGGKEILVEAELNTDKKKQTANLNPNISINTSQNVNIAIPKTNQE